MDMTPANPEIARLKDELADLRESEKEAWAQVKDHEGVIAELRMLNSELSAKLESTPQTTSDISTEIEALRRSKANAREALTRLWKFVEPWATEAVRERFQAALDALA